MAGHTHLSSSVLLAAALAAAFAGNARANPGGSIGITSDYVVRGVSQSRGEAAFQADLHWNFPRGWSVGAWASQVEYQPRKAFTELDGYLQWRGALNDDFDLAATATHYSYPGDPRPVSYSYDEFNVSLLWRDQFSIAAGWIPSLNLYSYDYGLATHRQIYTFEAGWHRDLLPWLDVSAGAGFYDPPGLEYASYGYGDLALGMKYGHWRMNLAWIWVQDTDHRQYTPGPAGGPLAATLSWVF